MDIYIVNICEKVNRPGLQRIYFQQRESFILAYTFKGKFTCYKDRTIG